MLNLLSKQLLLHYQSKWQSKPVVQRIRVWDRVHLVILGMLMGGFNLWIILQLLQPASLHERNIVIAYTEQALYPQSRSIARQWAAQPQPFNRFAYFKFLRTLAAEQNAIHYAPLEQQDTTSHSH